MVAFALSTWPGELAGVVDWAALCAALGGRHPQHAPRAMRAALEMMLALELTQPQAYDRVRRWMDLQLTRRRLELAQEHVEETLRGRGYPRED